MRPRTDPVDMASVRAVLDTMDPTADRNGLSRVPTLRPCTSTGTGNRHYIANSDGVLLGYTTTNPDKNTLRWGAVRPMSPPPQTAHKRAPDRTNGAMPVEVADNEVPRPASSATSHTEHRPPQQEMPPARKKRKVGGPLHTDVVASLEVLVRTWRDDERKATTLQPWWTETDDVTPIGLAMLGCAQVEPMVRTFVTLMGDRPAALRTTCRRVVETVDSYGVEELQSLESDLLKAWQRVHATLLRRIA